MRARSSHRSGSRRNPRRGSVILFVLGVIFLTAFLLTRLIDRAGGELLAETRASARAGLRDEAYSSLEVTLAVLADAAAADGGLHAPQQGWANPLEYAGYEPPAGFAVTVAFEDETGKLPLATTNPAVLQLYLETIGATKIEAEQLADALLGWTRSDYLTGTNEADPRNYESAPIPYAPPHRALRSFEELRAVAVARELFFDHEGRWSELGERFRADASLQSFSHVNVNTARPAVLQALGLDRTNANALVDDLRTPAGRPQDAKFYRTTAEASAAHGAAITQADLGADVQCLRVIVTAKQGARTFRLEAVIEPGTSGSGGAAATATPGAAPATAAPDPNEKPTTPVDPRVITTKRIDYPFRILELSESDGSN